MFDDEYEEILDDIYDEDGQVNKPAAEDKLYLSKWVKKIKKHAHI